MAVNFLTVADYPAVRAAIRSDVGESDLPDQTIAFATPWASQQVLAIDTQAPWPDGSDEAQRDHDAAVLLSAAALAGSVPFMEAERFKDYDYRYAKFDPIMRAETLRQMAIAILDLTVAETLLELTKPTMMTLAPGGRGDISDLSDVIVGVGSGTTVLLGTGNVAIP